MVNYHYCMKKLASVQLFAAEQKECGQCGMHMEDNNGCCHDEVKVVKLQNDQQPTAAIAFALPVLEALVQEPSSFLATSFYNTPEERLLISHPPPLLSAQDTYLQIGVFRI